MFADQKSIGAILAGVVGGGLCWYLLDGLGEMLGVGIGLMLVAVGVYSLLNE